MTTEQADIIIQLIQDVKSNTSYLTGAIAVLIIFGMIMLLFQSLIAGVKVWK